MAKSTLQLIITITALCSFFMGSGFCGEVAMTEPQIKALCIINFTKYIDWPPEAFVTANQPIRIGVLGEKKVGANLKTAVAGKLVDAHPVEVVDISSADECAACQVLFFGAETKRTASILEAVKGQNILTIGETPQFAEAGGVITFTRRENKVRFEVNLAAARLAKLQISSKVLSLADAVRGKE